MNFLIKYEIKDIHGFTIKSGTMRVKNKANKFVAKCSLENYFKNKHADFYEMIVHSCVNDNQFFNNFNEIFKGFK